MLFFAAFSSAFSAADFRRHADAAPPPL